MTTVWAGVVLGVVSSVHCAAMCGPLVGAVRGGLFRSSVPVRGWRIRTSGLVYHAGRVGIYGVLGLLAGRAGEVMALRGFGRTVALAAGIALLLGVLGHATGPMTALGRAVARRLMSISAFLRRHCVTHPMTAAAGLGAVNGLLPCGLVYAALTIALTIGGAGDASTFMIAFGAGTTPVVFSAWLLAGWHPIADRRLSPWIAPAAMTIAAVVLITRAFVMPGGHGH